MELFNFAREAESDGSFIVSGLQQLYIQEDKCQISLVLNRQTSHEGARTRSGECPFFSGAKIQVLRGTADNKK